MKFRHAAIALTVLGLAVTTAPAADDASTMNSARSSGKSKRLKAGNAQTVRQVQEALKNKGYDPGPVDGMMGPKTRSALQQYQRSQNFTGSSGLDRKTLDALGVQTAAPPTAGGDSAEPDRSGRPAPTGAAKDSSPTRASPGASPTAGGNSTEPDRSGRPGPSAPSKDASSRTTPSTPTPTAGGNSVEPDKSGRSK